MKILLVDDSKSARYALRLQLQRYGVSVETSDAAEPALEHVREDPPDAIFMDHTMPGMNGFEALDILQSTPATAHIPVVMCTSNEDPDFIAQAKKKGAFGVLAKSTAGEKLSDLLARVKQVAATPKEGAVPAVPAAPQADMVQLEERFRGLIDSLIDERAGRLAADLTAQVDERIEARVRTSIEPLLDDLMEGVTKDLMAKTDERLASGLDREAQRLQKQFLEVQKEQAQQTTNRLLNESLPQLLRQQFKQEKEDLTVTMQERLDLSLSALAENADFVRRISDVVETAVIGNTERIVKRHATEIAETVATKHATAVAGELIETSRPDKGPMILLAAGAAVVGIAAAAVVYYLLAMA